jgi:hypothetical protein
MISEVLKQINWISVLVATLAYFALGAIWYSFLFQKKWIAYNKIDMSDPNGKKGVGAIMLASFIITFIVCIGLAILAEYMSLKGFHHGFHLGALTGLCFAATSIAVNMLYEKKPLGLFFINAGYQVLGTIIAAMIIVCWR